MLAGHKYDRLDHPSHLSGKIENNDLPQMCTESLLSREWFCHAFDAGVIRLRFYRTFGAWRDHKGRFDDTGKASLVKI